ncbi:MAG TPA: clostripain-related cysteine peptidase, partial [Anaerolineae bacterium]
DIIAFDASLMAQLDVFRAVQPYARYAVASEALTLGQGWNYQSLLSQLVANPQLDGIELARHMVVDFAGDDSVAEPDAFVTMSAVDLARLPALAYTVDVLATTLTVDPAFVAAAVSDARREAEAFALVYADAVDRYAAVDLVHFASILTQRSRDERVIAAAQEVVQAAGAAVVAHAHGGVFENSHGLSIYFPRKAGFYDAGYEPVGTAAWNTFLHSYHSAGLADLPPPQVHLANRLDRPAGAQNPAFFDVEIVGREIDKVAIFAGRHEADGRLRLLQHDTLIPDPAFLLEGSQVIDWDDGVHHDSFTWRAEATYLFDAAGNGDFALTWPAESGGQRFVVQGRYRRSNGDVYFEANLVFDEATGRLARVWGLDVGGVPAELLPQPGDEFQLYTLYRDAAGTTVREPGPTLVFDESGQFSFERRPLPDGNYFVGLRAENAAAAVAETFVDLAVTNGDIVPGYEAYLDPYLGFRFLYPQTWHAPVYSDTLLVTRDRQRPTQMQTTIYPNLQPGTELSRLKAQTLAQFGPVDVLFEDELVVAGLRGLRTAYGYSEPDGTLHTGIFFTFIHEDTGFVVDVDGLTEDEAATIATAATMAESWTLAPAGFGPRPGKWARVDFDTFSVTHPADFVYQPFNEWQRFSSGRYTFLALRTGPAGNDAARAVAALVRDAGTGVEDFAAGEPYRFPLAGAVWQRVDFSYQTAEGDDIWGFIMVKVVNGQEVVAWAEAPASAYNELERNVFLLMIADLTLAD